MGRTEKSQGLAPPAIRKDVRAKQARHIVNKVVPAIISSNSRARRGAENSELIVDPKQVTEATLGSKDKEDETQYVKRKGQGKRKAKGGDEDAVVRAGPEKSKKEKDIERRSLRWKEGEEDVQYVKRKGQSRRKVESGDVESVVKAGHEKENKGRGKGKKDSLDDIDISALTIKPSVKEGMKARTRSQRLVRIVATDSLTVAHMLTVPSKYADSEDHEAKASKKKQANVCVLNMASPLRPGGGVLTGATSQEEFLCARTTLLPSLKESFYRLPEVGGIYTHDVNVFRSSAPLGTAKSHLAPGDRYWIDVISAGMLRFPELEGEEDDIKRLGKKDRELVEKKMRAVLRIACAKGIKKLVLGAWGCGAYGNPVGDIARAWRQVFDGATENKKGKFDGEIETWEQIEEVIFAISNVKMAADFATDFGGGIEVEKGPGGAADEDDDEDEEEDKVAEELRIKIQEMEGQIAQVWNPDLKSRMGVILDGLRAQLKQREGITDDNEDDGDDVESDSENEIDSENGDEDEDQSSDDEEAEVVDDELGDSWNIVTTSSPSESHDNKTSGARH